MTLLWWWLCHQFHVSCPYNHTPPSQCHKCPGNDFKVKLGTEVDLNIYPPVCLPQQVSLVSSIPIVIINVDLNINIICSINININMIISRIIINIVLIFRTKTLLVSWDGSTVIVHFFSLISDAIICFENESYVHKSSINLHIFV